MKIYGKFLIKDHSFPKYKCLLPRTPFISPKEIQKNRYLETFLFILNYQQKGTIKPQYLFNRITLKIQRLM